MPTSSNLITRFRSHPSERTAIIWLGEDGRGEEIISYGALDRMARAVAVSLRGVLDKGESARATEFPPRVVLLCKPGPGFIAGFLGCLYAKVIAVPAYPIEHVRHLPRLRSLLDDAQPDLVLLDSSYEQVKVSADAVEAIPALRTVPVLDVKTALGGDADAYTPQDIGSDDIAFLQYTSGSTGNPRGVIITHGNLTANLELIRDAMEFCETDTMVSWLPMYHDMGLVGCVLEPLYLGFRTVLMPPSAFLTRPNVWWEAISKYGGNVTGAPNFAYALSTRRMPAEAIARLDLSSLRVTFNGAEPIRSDTMEAFAAAFAPAKLNPTTIFPCYGLAETTLFTSGGPCGSGVKSIGVSRKGLHEGRFVTATADADTQCLVSCGAVAPGLKVKIVDPATNRACKPGRVGEIHISGPSVSRGYWQKPEVNAEVFKDGVLRTGDLGALVDGELYITGRIKDTIIIAGKNHYPQDIEATVEQASDQVRPGCVVAYGTDLSDPKLGIVAEVRKPPADGADLATVAQSIARSVGVEHTVPVARVTLIAAGQLPKTSSGKLQRSLTRESVEAGELKTLYAWPASGNPHLPVGSSGDSEQEANQELGTPREDTAPQVNELLAYLRWYGANRMNSRLMDERRCFAPHVILDIGNVGLLGFFIPKEFGGLGLGATEFVAVGQQICSMDLSLGLFWGLNNTLGTYPILQAGTKEQKLRFLPALAQGRMIASFALSEPAAGSNPMSIQADARETARGNYVLNGEKTWIGGAAWAGVITVFAKEHAADGTPRGITAFAIEQGRKGLLQGPEQLTLGLRAMVQNRIYFQDLALDEQDRLGPSGDGMRLAADTMNLARFGLGVMALGTAKRAMQLGVRYASRRTVNTGTLAEHPLVVGDLTDAALGIAALEALLKRCARAMDGAGGGIPDVDRVPEAWPMVAKVFGSELCGQVVDRAMQLAGGRGYIETNVIAQLWRDARILRIFEGPTETLEYHLGNLMTRGHLDACLKMHRAKGATQWAERLRADLKTLQERCPDRHLYRSLAGRVSSWAILAMVLVEDAAADPLNGPALDWVERQYAVALTWSEAKASGLEHAARIGVGNIVAGYVAAIGDVEQTLPAEEWKLDPMLRRDESAAAMDRPALIPRTFAMARVAVPQPRSLTSSGTAARPAPGNGSANRRDATTAAPSIAGPPRRTPPRRSGSKASPAVSAAAVPPAIRQAVAAPTAPAPGMSKDVEAISQQIVTWFCRSANVPAEIVTPDVPFTEIGLDSLTAAEIAALVEETYHIRVQATLLWDCPTIRHVAEHVTRKM